jgi:2-dehydro-3-deoxyphosphogluconate aldolase/(4S)-4-hydroxy-2-oxoglutarate aldolase
MPDNSTIINRIAQQGFLPLFFQEDVRKTKSVVQVLYTSGVKVIEFTNRSTQALGVFKELAEFRNQEMPDLMLAAGTIRTVSDAGGFLDAGADFLISPVFDQTLASFANARCVFWVPGCSTPTEIHLADLSGCRVVKLFPGNQLGPGFVQAIKPLFPGIRFMPTGGVELNEENMGAWFSSGVFAVGLGSSLVSRSIMDDEQYEELKRRTGLAMQIIERVKHVI